MPTPTWTVTGTPNTTKAYAVEYEGVVAVSTVSALVDSGSGYSAAGNFTLNPGNGTSNPLNLTLGSNPCIGLTPNSVSGGRIRLVEYTASVTTTTTQPPATTTTTTTQMAAGIAVSLSSSANLINNTEFNAFLAGGSIPAKAVVFNIPTTGNYVVTYDSGSTPFHLIQTSNYDGSTIYDAWSLNVTGLYRTTTPNSMWMTGVDDFSSESAALAAATAYNQTVMLASGQVWLALLAGQADDSIVTNTIARHGNITLRLTKT